MAEHMTNKHSDLYVAPPAFSKEAGKKMPPDTELWSEVVFSLFSEQWPDLAELSSGDVDWDKSKLDEEYGFGIGNIVIKSGNVIVRVPIIVKDYHLQPIDIFESEGKMQLLNDENIGAALKEQDSLGEVAHPSRTDFKSTKFVQWLSKGATPNGWKARVDAFVKIAKPLSGPYLDRPMQCFIDVPIKEGKDASVVYFEKTGKLGELRMIGYLNGEVIQMGPASFDDPDILINDTLKEASKLAYNNGYSLAPVQEIKEAEVGFLGIDASEDLGLIDEPGVYKGKQVTEDGMEDVPVFAMNVLPFGAEELPEKPRMVYVVQGEDGLNYAPQESAIGKAHKSSKFNFSESMVPLNDVSRYDKGFILFEDGKDVKTSSDLVTIERVEQTPNGRLRIFMKTAEGNVHYLLDESFKRVLPLASDDNLFSNNYNLNLTGPNVSFLKVLDSV